MLDINIQGSKDGIDLALIVKEKYDIPFIFLTALSYAATLERAKIAQPCAYLVKPYKTVDLHTSLAIGLFNFQSQQKKRRD